MTVSALIAMSLSSCVKKPIYKTSHPDKGAVVLTADWSEALSEAYIPSIWAYRVNGSEAFYAENQTHCHSGLLLPGKHKLLAYNEPQDITLDGTRAVVDTVPEGLLVAQPEYLYSATQELEMVQDDTLRVTIPMKRLLIPLSMKVTLDPASVDNVADIKASLSGVSDAVDLETWEIGKTPKSVMLDVVSLGKASDAVTGDKIELKCRIVGICPDEKQILTVTITNKDGVENTVTSDLTEELEGINTGKDPVELEGSISAAQDGHFSGTIDNWDEVSGGDVDAN